MPNKYYKYPRTPHLPWSPGVGGDDIKLQNSTKFIGKHVVVTEKLDGENTTLYLDHIHARSVNSKQHISRNWVKALHGEIAHLIPAGWRVCGENLYAKHSIAYTNLTSYFFVFSIWDETNTCLSWNETIEWSTLLGLETVPVVYRGVWNESSIREIRVDLETQEGYVVRNSDNFHYDNFSENMAKWVRKNHVQTDQHWLHAEVIPNQLIEGDKNEN